MSAILDAADPPRLEGMRADQQRGHFERLILRVSTEVIGEDGDCVLEPLDSRPSEARIRLTSRAVPDRSAGLTLDAEWLQAFFFLEPHLSILKMDDYVHDDQYVVDEVRELVHVIHAYLRGEGSLEPRRTILGRRRSS